MSFSIKPLFVNPKITDKLLEKYELLASIRNKKFFPGQNMGRDDEDGVYPTPRHNARRSDSALTDALLKNFRLAMDATNKRAWNIRTYYDAYVQPDGSILFVPKDVNRNHYFIGWGPFVTSLYSYLWSMKILFMSVCVIILSLNIVQCFFKNLNKTGLNDMYFYWKKCSRKFRVYILYLGKKIS